DTLIYGGLHTGKDEPLGQEFIRLSPEKAAVEIDFAQDPLRAQANFDADTYSRYFFADPQHFLDGFDIEVRYRLEADGVPGITLPLTARGDLLIGAAKLDASDVWRDSRALPPGRRVLKLALKVAKGASI